MSLTFQDRIFPVAWFSMWMKCPSHSMQTILYVTNGNITFALYIYIYSKAYH